MKNLSRSVLAAAVFSALATLLIAIFACYFRSNLDVIILSRAVAVANEPSASLQKLSSIIEQLVQLTQSLIQIASGIFIYTISIGALSTLLLFLIYMKLKRSEQ